MTTGQHGVHVSTLLIFGRMKMEDVGQELQFHACRGKEQTHSNNNSNSLETSVLILPIVLNKVQQHLFLREAKNQVAVHIVK